VTVAASTATVTTRGFTVSTPVSYENAYLLLATPAAEMMYAPTPGWLSSRVGVSVVCKVAY
jgi:hypothetical protein